MNCNFCKEKTIRFLGLRSYRQELSDECTRREKITINILSVTPVRTRMSTIYVH